MADKLASEADLAALLQITVNSAAAAVALEAATAVVQEAAGQRIVQVTGDLWSGLGTIEAWLQLPQQPVTAVTTVKLDDVAVTDWKKFGSRLWRKDAWQAYLYQPSTVEVTYSHGYATGSQDLQFARSATLMLARHVYPNPTGLSSESIGDYSYAYEKAAEHMQVSPNVRNALRRKYGIRAGLARIGGS